MPDVNIKEVIGDNPNEAWIRSGQFVLFVSTLSFFGINVTGIEQSAVSSGAPIVGFFLGLMMMLMGTYFRGVYLQKTQDHEEYTARLTNGEAIKAECNLCPNCHVQVDRWISR